jgi:type-F conjugative transfer system pilin assembly protein TrbC
VFVEASVGDLWELFVDDLSVGRQQVKSLEIVDVTGLLDRAKTASGKIKTSENKHAVEMQKIAEATKAVYDSPQFQAKLKAEQERIKAATIGDQFDNYYRDVNSKESNLSFVHLGEDERLYIFVSSSMPVAVVRQYAADVAKLGDKKISLVLRGFIGGMSKIAPTVNFVSDVLKKNSFCELSESIKCEMLKAEVIVDPLLYRRYGITQVPSFVYVKGIKSSNPDMSEGDLKNLSTLGDVYKVAGDASLKYVLSKIADEAQSGQLDKISRRLR